MVYHGHDYSLSQIIKRVQNEGLGWRVAGERYTLREVLADAGEIFRHASYVHRAFVWGCQTKQLRTVAEILFPFLRPWCEYLGFRYATRYLS